MAEFARVFLICFITFLGLYVVTDFVNNLDELISHGQSNGGLAKTLLIQTVSSVLNLNFNMDDMIKVTVIDREGVKHELDAPTDMDMNMMELCKSYELPVEGTCGGMALCASCHMYVHSDHELREPSEDEEDMLDMAFGLTETSRLGCQVEITAGMDNMVVEMPKATRNFYVDGHVPKPH